MPGCAARICTLECARRRLCLMTWGPRGRGAGCLALPAATQGQAHPPRPPLSQPREQQPRGGRQQVSGSGLNFGHPSERGSLPSPRDSSARRERGCLHLQRGVGRRERRNGNSVEKKSRQTTETYFIFRKALLYSGILTQVFYNEYILGGNEIWTRNEFNLRSKSASAQSDPECRAHPALCCCFLVVHLLLSPFLRMTARISPWVWGPQYNASS